MQVNFHYYGIGILARAAGFSSRDALIIAYASQYSDDAMESRPINLYDQQGNFKLRFDPTRTAYVGLKANNWGVHKRVYIPYHFIPAHPFQYNDPASYQQFGDMITLPDSPFARLLLKEAARERNRKRRLCRLGIALHTYADSWTHEGFSGRSSKEENGIDDIAIWEEGGWKEEHFTDWIVETFTEVFAREVGHAEAGTLPDLSFLRWKFTKEDGRVIERDNQQVQYEAARTIYEALTEIIETSDFKKDAVRPIPWEEIAAPLRGLLAYRGSIGPTISLLEKIKLLAGGDFIQESVHKWQGAFRQYFDPPSSYHYDRQEWRNLALDPGVKDPYYSERADFWAQDDDWLLGEVDRESWGRSRSDWQADMRGFDYGKRFDFEVAGTDWDEWDQAQFERSKFILKPSFPDSLWVHFHRAALKQRHFVMERLP